MLLGTRQAEGTSVDDNRRRRREPDEEVRAREELVRLFREMGPGRRFSVEKVAQTLEGRRQEEGAGSAGSLDQTTKRPYEKAVWSLVRKGVVSPAGSSQAEGDSAEGALEFMIIDPWAP